MMSRQSPIEICIDLARRPSGRDGVRHNTILTMDADKQLYQLSADLAEACGLLNAIIEYDTMCFNIGKPVQDAIDWIEAHKETSHD